MTRRNMDWARNILATLKGTYGIDDLKKLLNENKRTHRTVNSYCLKKLLSERRDVTKVKHSLNSDQGVLYTFGVRER